MNWKYVFEEYAGYDCMYDGYIIYDEKGEDVCVIDCNKKGRDKKCEKQAKLIVEAVNKFREDLK